MKKTNKVVWCLMLVLFLTVGMASFVLAQKKNKKAEPTKKTPSNITQPIAEASPTPDTTPSVPTPTPTKKNIRNSASNGETQPQPSPAENKSAETSAIYFYEFTQPNFVTSHIVIEHGADGKGSIVFERKNAEEPIKDPIEISPKAWARIKSLWEALNFLDSEENYQSEKQFPHLGTMRVKMKHGERERTAEFNWTNDKNASELVNEYRRVADQAIFIFDVNLAREISPLATPKLLDSLDSMLKRNSISDPKQLIPFLKDLSVDERLPLITRNHASRLIKQLEK